VHRFHCNCRVARAQALSSEAVGLIAVGLGPDQFTVRRPAPEIGSGSTEEFAGKTAGQLDYLTGIGALKGGPREVE